MTYSIIYVLAVFVWDTSPLTKYKNQIGKKFKMNCQGVKYLTSKVLLGRDVAGPPLYVNWLKNGKIINISQSNVSL